MEQIKEKQTQEARAWLQQCLPLLPLNAAHWALTSIPKEPLTQHQANGPIATTSFYRPYSQIVQL